MILTVVHFVFSDFNTVRWLVSNLPGNHGINMINIVYPMFQHMYDWLYDCKERSQTVNLSQKQISDFYLNY